MTLDSLHLARFADFAEPGLVLLAIFTLIICCLLWLTYWRRSQWRAATRLAETCQLQDIIGFLPDPTFVVDRERRVVIWNRAMEELSGVPASDMLGKGDQAYAEPFYGERRPVLIDQLAGGHLGRFGDLYENLQRKGNTLCAESFAPRLNQGQGAYLWLTASPFFNAEGQFAGAVESVRDVTPRKMAEASMRAAEERISKLNIDLEQKVVAGTRELLATNEALRGSEARYRRLVENLSDGYIFYAHSRQDSLSYVSPSYRTLLGFETRREFALAVETWLKHPSNAEARQCSEKSHRGQRQPAFDCHAWRKDGTPVVFRVLEVPVFDEAGEVTSVEGVAHDVTAERRNLELVRAAEKQLLEAEKMGALGSLVAGLSHEINTPVGVAVTAGSHLCEATAKCQEVYRDGGLTRQGFEEYLDLVGEAGDLLQSNLNRSADLLQNFKLVAVDQSAGQERVFQLAEYFGDILQSLSPHFRHTGFKVRYECPADLALKCDPGALYQIITNLVLNSLKHGFEGLLMGEILIRARVEGKDIQIEYMDNGIGMTSKELARIYEPFFTTKRGQGGTGLGMHIVYNNVTQNLNGTISCRSKPGRGVQITITTPLLVEVQYG